MKSTSETIALILTFVILLGLPAALFGYKRVYLPHKLHGARIISLTALATDGVWTQEPVRGTNYWRKHFSPTPEIQVQPGETVVLRLASADVLHSFAIPALDIGPLEVPAGEVREVTFTPQRPDTLIFLCWQVCSPVHEKLRGRIVVVGPNGQAGPKAPTQEPEL